MMAHICIYKYDIAKNHVKKKAICLVVLLFGKPEFN